MLSIGAFLSASVSIPYFNNIGLFEQRPYNNVTVYKVQYTDPEYSKLQIDAEFVKASECTFERLEVHGEYLGRWEILEWYDPTGEKGDRNEGYQTLDIVVNTYGLYFSTIEVRTRHSCPTDTGPKKVDEIMLSETPKEYDFVYEDTLFSRIWRWVVNGPN